MNSKIILLSFLLLLFTACGKKGPPIVPADSILPSYEDHFINQNKIQSDPEEEKKGSKEVKKKNN